MELSSIVLPVVDLINMEIPKDVESFKGSLEAYVIENAKNDIYFSSEHLSSRMSMPYVIQDFLEVIRAGGHKIIVIAYVRNPRDWIVSHYKQYVSSGGCLSYLEYINEANDPSSFIFRTTNFGPSLLNWKKCLTDKDIFSLVDYDLVKRGLIEDFCRRVDLDYRPDLNFGVSSNQSLLDSQVRILRCFNLVAKSRFLRSLFKNIISFLNFNNSFKFENVGVSGVDEFCERQSCYVNPLL
jgi:hypothetical protein